MVKKANFIVGRLITLQFGSNLTSFMNNKGVNLLKIVIMKNMERIFLKVIANVIMLHETYFCSILLIKGLTSKN